MSAGAAARRIRIGMLGASWIAPHAITTPAKSMPNAVEAYGIAARDKRRATEYAKKHGITKVFDDYESLVTDPNVDAVYIGLQNSGHIEWAIKALRAGKHVLCEKPMACNERQCKEISAAAIKARKYVCMEAFHYRYHPLMKRVLEIISSGAMGAVKRVEAALKFFIWNLNDIRFQFALGGGCEMDSGPYTINAMRACLFAPVAGVPPTPVSIYHAAVKAKAKAEGKESKTDSSSDAKSNPAIDGVDPSVWDAGYQELRLTSASAKLLTPAVDQSFEAHFEAADAQREQTARISSSLRSLIPKVALTVIGQDHARLDVTNFVLPQLLYHSLTITDRKTGRTTTEKFPNADSSYLCQLKAFVDAIRCAEAEAAAPDADSRDIQAAIRKIIPTDHIDAVLNQRVADDIYLALGLPLRGEPLPPPVKRGAKAVQNTRKQTQPQSTTDVSKAEPKTDVPQTSAKAKKAD